MKITTLPRTTPPSQSSHSCGSACRTLHTHRLSPDSSHHLYPLKSHPFRIFESTDRAQLAADATNLHVNPSSLLPTILLRRDLFRQNRLLCIKSASETHMNHLRFRNGQEKRHLAVFEPLLFAHLLNSLEIMMQPEVFQSHLVIKVEIEVLQHLPARHYLASPRFPYNAS